MGDLVQVQLQTDKTGITVMGRLLVRVVLVLTNKFRKGSRAESVQ